MFQAGVKAVVHKPYAVDGPREILQALTKTARMISKDKTEAG
jgi:hypothetical protein